MAGRYEIELSAPRTVRCDCCGGLNVRLTRFVYRDGDAFAVYYAAYSNGHADEELGVLVSLGEWGEWGEGSAPAHRVAFYCRVRPTRDSYEVILDDAGRSIWSEVDTFGEKLTREAAVGHPWKATLFEILDAALSQDRSLRGFLQRVQCGDAAVPLEKSFQAPDDVFALGGEAKARAVVSRNFASLDGTRFFVRCLLPVPVEGYGRWCIGVWVEVSGADHARIADAWDAPQEYVKLRCSGALANDVGADLELPIKPRAEVHLHVPDRDAPPHIEAPATGELAALLSAPWPKADFEEYAVARGFL